MAKRSQKKAEKKYRKASQNTGSTLSSLKARNTNSKSGFGANKGVARVKDKNKKGGRKK